MENLEDSSQPTQSEEPVRGRKILALGILSLVLLGPVAGIPAWIMGKKDLRKIDDGIIPPSERKSTHVGMIMGMIGSIYTTAILAIGIFLSISSYSDMASASARDALVAGCTKIADDAQVYYAFPKEMQGGGNSFIGFEIRADTSKTSNCKYSIENLDSQSLTITGIGKIKGKDRVNPVKVTITVLPRSAQNDIQVNILN
jgi:hypothetical protein